MALVAYSDSEGSDTESSPSAPSLPPTKPKSSLPSFLPPPSKKRKLVVDDNNTKSDASGPRKIKIELPKVTSDVGDAAPTSSSRTKIGKSSGGGGLLSFLPAPKRTGADAVKVAQESKKEEKVAATTAAASSSAPRTLGGGIKKLEYAGTGMDLKPTVEDDLEPEPTTTAAEEEEVLTKPPVETKPAGPIQGRVIQPFFRKSTTKKTAKPNGPKKVEEKKVSLFSLGSALNEKPLTAVTASTASEYKPLLVEESAPAVEDEIPVEALYHQEEYAENSNQPALGPQTFQSISEEVGMDEASMRMFMGRRGRNAEIKLMDFNVDHEYEKNEAARAAGELAPERNVVRSVKPGKHQLTSLLNAAQSQRAALEESFAEGRRNKKESGSKYGW